MFSCPYCNESETSSKKHSARGYLLVGSRGLYYYCHRCGKWKPTFRSFLQDQDEGLYKEYLAERFVGNKKPEDFNFTWTKDLVVLKSNPINKLDSVWDLPDDHYAKLYVQSRKIFDSIPLFFTPKFKTWVNSFIPSKFDDVKKDHSRLIIPFYNKNEDLHAFQGRAFSDKISPRYLTILTDERFPSIWGLDRVDLTKIVFVTEGPIDAMFVNNCLASCGGNVFSKLSSYEKDNLVLVYDNEPRSSTTILKMRNAILNGYNVVIWPESFIYKDVNQAIIDGVTQQEINEIIRNNIYKDLSASLALTTYAKVNIK